MVLRFQVMIVLRVGAVSARFYKCFRLGFIFYIMKKVRRDRDESRETLGLQVPNLYQLSFFFLNQMEDL